MSDWFIIILGAILVGAWVTVEFWDYLSYMWDAHIISDYPYEDDL